MVKCPVCKKEVPLPLINSHLDEHSMTSANDRKRPAPSSSPPAAPAPENPTKRRLSDVLTGNRRKTRHTGSFQYKLPEPSGAADDLEMLSSDPPAVSSQHVSAGISRKQEKIKELRLASRLPLAERLRPKTLEEYVGQTELVGPGGILRGFIESDRIPSMILWGYPGTGKTTLARIISHRTKSRFVELSATANGIADCKRVFEEAKHEMKLTRRKTIVFVDEIHRFNKAQQDIFLPFVERGTITLIGATTENPSFQLNSALLSRCRVFTLRKLTGEEIREIIQRALLEINKTRRLVYNKAVLKFESAAVDYLCNISDGDSRSALNLLELSDSHYMDQIPKQGSQFIDVEAAELKSVLKRSQMVYDRVGDAHYDTISAFHKSVRGSCPDAALYYLARMLKGGEDPLYVARRMIRIASEDVGIVDDSCLPFAVATYKAVQMIGMPECDVILAHCAVKLARAQKSVEVNRAFDKIKSMITNDPDVGSAAIPLHLRNAPTKLMEDLGYKKGYKYNPDYVNGEVKQEYFPKQLEGMTLLDGLHLGTQIDPDL